MDLDGPAGLNQVPAPAVRAEPLNALDRTKYTGGTLNPKRIVFKEHWGRVEEVVNKVMDGIPFDAKVWDDAFFDVYGLCAVQNVVDLYAKLIELLLNRVKLVANMLEPLHGADLIQAYAYYWRTFDTGVKHVHDLCRYMNRMMQRETNARTFSRKFKDLEILLQGKNLHVCEAARKLWRTQLMIPLNEKLYDVIWSEFRRTRASGYTQQPDSGFKVLMDSFISVCFPTDEDRDQVLSALDPTICTHQRFPMPIQLNFYTDYFEDRFLQQNREHFRQLMAEQLISLDMFDYMTQVLRVLEHEEQLADNLLFSTTVRKLLVLLRKIFILEQLPRFDQVVPEYVRCEKKQELRITYVLLDFFPDAASILISEYEKQIASSLEAHLTGLFLNPSVFTEAVCAKHNYYTQFNAEVFNDSPYMQAALRRALETVVNKERDGEKFYASKMLARHMDLLLKKQSKNRASDLEDKLDEAVTIFRYVRDKDTFHKIFQRLFSIRLLGKLSVSLEIETLVIEKLREACGHDYTSKLYRMYQDCQKSKQLIEAYWAESRCEEAHQRENEFVVIQTCAWPVISSAEDAALRQLRLPPDYDHFTRCYRAFYENKHSGRVLKFAHHVSTADVQVRVGQRRCTATMTVPQALVLLQLDAVDRASIQDLADATGLAFEYVAACLKALTDFKLLRLSTGKECCTPDSVVEVNTSFEALRARVHLQPPAVVSKAQETNPVPSSRETLQDRKVAVECAIVRAMKTRKLMKHQELVDFVLSTISSRFVPDRGFLKQCVEGLIDKHFLQRTDNIDEYEYLP